MDNKIRKSSFKKSAPGPEPIIRVLKTATPISFVSNYGGSNSDWDFSHTIPSNHFVVDYGVDCPKQGSGWGYMNCNVTGPANSYGGTLRCWGSNDMGYEIGQGITVSAWYKYYEE